MDVTEQLLAYRETARHLWNTSLRQIATMDDVNPWDVRDRFEDSCDTLFLDHVVVEKRWRSGEPLPIRVVAPKGGLEMHVNREKGERSGDWGFPCECVGRRGLELAFVDFFDFDVLGWRDFEYAEVLIRGCTDEQDLEGRFALVRPGLVSFESTCRE